jgi:hypothetical protein
MERRLESKKHEDEEEQRMITFSPPLHYQNFPCALV